VGGCSLNVLHTLSVAMLMSSALYLTVYHPKPNDGWMATVGLVWLAITTNHNPSHILAGCRLGNVR
jgi:hypothetical protein